MEAALSKLTHAVERQTELDAATLSAIQQLARQVTARPPRRSLAIEPTSQPSEDAYSRPLERSTGLAPLSNEGGASMPQSDSTLTSGGATQQTDSQLPSQPLAGASFDSLGSDAGLASNVRRSPSKRGLERAPSVEAGRKVSNVGIATTACTQLIQHYMTPLRDSVACSYAHRRTKSSRRRSKAGSAGRHAGRAGEL